MSHQNAFPRALMGIESDPLCEAALEASPVPLSVVQNGETIAFASYSEESNIVTMEECRGSGYESQEASTRIVSKVRPTLLLLSSKVISDSALLDSLRKLPANPSEGLEFEDGQGGPQNNVETACGNEAASSAGGLRCQQHTLVPYRIMKTSTFDIQTCKAAILNMKVGSLRRQKSHDAETTGQSPSISSDALTSYNVSSFHSLAAIIDFGSIAQIQALGALLSFLRTTVFQLQSDGDLIVNDVVRTKTVSQMMVSADTLYALHVFATEHHPLGAAKGNGQSKEGFSLFSLLDRTASLGGRRRLREWMLTPLAETKAIKARQDGVELFMLPDHVNVANSMAGFLEKIGAVDKILLRIQKCIVKTSDFLVVAKSLSGAVALIDTLRNEILWNLHQRAQTDLHHFTSTQPYIAFVTSVLDRCHISILHELFERVTSIIDEEATLDTKTLVIRPGYDTHLDKLKEEFNGLSGTLAEIGAKLVQETPQLKDLLSVIFLPQVGFLISLDDNVDWQADGAVPDDYAFVFAECDCVFFKNSDMETMDTEIGDLDAYIKDAEKLIMAELEEDILDCDAELRGTFDAMADLDCILAFAHCATDRKYVRPTVVEMEMNCIEITKGRHPLSELITDTDFVQNDTHIDKTNRVNVITGPNFSGKSCYARQVGLLSFMAHLGCFLPCEAATISVTDQIIARFSSIETCTVPQSSFQLDLTQMGSILRQATPKSLVIIDEFGKGTSPASGIALLAAALRYFATECQSKVICTTHFLEVFSMGLIQDCDNGVKAHSMRVHTSQKTQVPLFLLEEGVSRSSAGLLCATIAGVTHGVISRADEVLSAVKNRRKVQPLVEILSETLEISSSTANSIDRLITSELKDCSDAIIAEYVKDLLQS